MSASEHEGGVGPYRIEGTLGEGGMGAVYRARERASGRLVALKRLLPGNDQHRERLLELFEREYHTLSQLSHPAAIEVFDYGVDERGAYYTMELLEGEQLHRARQLPVPELCGVLHAVASCLSLLHARRLVHRDVTARNIIVTAPGRAKLIDFGALAPMGSTHGLVGTPTHVAPEAVRQQTLDGRADLYALGVVMYRVLTERYPYLARTVHDLRELWTHAPPTPIELNPALSKPLSDFVMALIALDREARPRDAAEVMERLSALGGLSDLETAEASHAYLVTPALVGRGNALRRMGTVLQSALRGEGRSLVFRGRAGVGRSRMAEASALAAQLRGAAVLRVHGAQDRVGNFSAAEGAIEELRLLAPERVAALQAAEVASAASPEAPRSTPPSGKEAGRREAIERFCRVVIGYVATDPLVLVADDLQLMDEPSLAAIATALQRVGACKLLFVGTLVDSADAGSATLGAVEQAAAASLSLRLLLERSTVIELGPLGVRASRELTRSVFGAVPHVGALATRLHRVSRGNPRELIALAEHLLSTGVIGYRGGTFALPAQIADDALPGSLAEALHGRITALGPLARGLAEVHALSGRRALTTAELRTLASSASLQAVHAALDELVAADILATGEAGFGIRHRGWSSALVRSVGDATRKRHHRALAALLRAQGSDPLSEAHHELQAGDDEAAIGRVAAFAAEHGQQGAGLFALTALAAPQLCALFDRVSDILAARERGTETRLRAQLRYLQMTLGALGDAEVFFAHAHESERSLTRDSGWDVFQTLDPALEPLPRVLEALRIAQQAYTTASDAHLFAPAEAIRNLVMYAVASLAASARSMDNSQRRRMPVLLEPFTPLSPLVAAMHQNCLSGAEAAVADYEQAAERLVSVVQTLSAPSAADQQHADEIRAACIYATASYRARLGIPDHEGLLDQVADHPRQSSNVLRTRAMLALHHGDWPAAAKLRQAAEQRDMELDNEPLFGLITVLSMVHLYARGLDLSSVKQLLSVLTPLAERFEGWKTCVHGAVAEYHRLRGDTVEALREFDLGAQALQPTSSSEHPFAAWYVAEASALELLLEQGRIDACRARAERALSWGDGQARGARYDPVQRAMALCQAKQGEFDAARHRLDALLAHRTALGTRGIELALLHEARALCAAWQGDAAAARDAFEHMEREAAPGVASGYSRRIARLKQQLEQEVVGAMRADSTRQTRESPTDPVRRAERALVRAVRTGDATAHGTLVENVDSVCRRLDSATGHLYALSAAGPRWLASVGLDGPPTGLSQFVAEQAERERNAPSGAHTGPSTHRSGALSRGTSAATATWVGPSGVRTGYRLLWLRDELQPDAPLVAVLVLSAPQDSDLVPTRVNG